jgi:hypothetical protein
MSSGVASGLTIAVSFVVAAAFWYSNRPVKERAWNVNAVVASYAGLDVETGQPFVATYRYTVENHTGRDYHLPSIENVYKVLPDKSLEKESTLKWAGGTAIPADQKMSISIQVEYDYTDAYSYADRDKVEKMSAFMGRRLSEIDGFVALDQNNRYEIRFPKPPRK